MSNRMRFILPFILVFAVITGSVLFSAWADPPVETTREFNQKIKVKFNEATGFPFSVQFGDGDGNYDDPVSPKTAWICTCAPGSDYGDSFVYDFDDPLVDCHPIKNAGPRSSGCPIFANPTYYLYSGDSYRR